MAETPKQYPLAWPTGRPRKTSRKAGLFRSGNSAINLAAAVARVEAETKKMGAAWLLISSNVQPTISGKANADVKDPGVCVYFTLKGEQFAMACDTYTAVPQNLAAIAAHLETVRAQERYGVATAQESLRAFTALPPPGSGPGQISQQRPWSEVLDLPEQYATEETIQRQYRKRAIDLGKNPANDSAVKELNIARDDALRSVKGG